MRVLSLVFYTMTMSAIIIWVSVACLCRPINSFDIVETLTYWFLEGHENVHEEILVNEKAQNKLIMEQELIKNAIQTVHKDHQKLKSYDLRWKIYGETCNIMMFVVVKWVLSLLDHRERIKDEELRELQRKRDYEPFCDENLHQGLLHHEWRSVCEKAFADDYFKNKRWTLRRRNETQCVRVDVKKIQRNPDSNKRDVISFNRPARYCPATEEYRKSSFGVYLIAGLSYKPTGERFSFYVLLERGKRDETEPKKGFFKSMLNDASVEVAAYIEK